MLIVITLFECSYPTKFENVQAVLIVSTPLQCLFLKKIIQMFML